MEGRSVFYILILIGCATVCSSGGSKGKKVLLKIHVPQLIKHQHHTNVVFVHKHHKNHGGHGNQHKHHHHHHHHHHDGDNGHNHHGVGGKPHADYHSHSFGGHYSHNYGAPPGFHHSHSFGHQHHYRFSNGQGNNLHGDKYHGHQFSAPKKKTNIKKGGGQKHGLFGKKRRKHKPNHGGNQKFPDVNKNSYCNLPNGKTGHYHYENYNPTVLFKNNKNLRESNQSIRHESLKIQGTGNSFPGAQNFGRTKGGYEVDEPSFDFDAEYHNAKSNGKPTFGGFQGSSDYDDAERNKGLGSYAEDYTDPNSVAKYTAAIKHGAINLEDSNYNPEHGNDLEEYIREFKNSDEI